MIHERLNYPQHAPEVFKKLGEATFAMRGGSLDKLMMTLIEIRASQINGCAFCLDMHIKEAKIAGERDLRLHHIAAWRESQLFDDRERMALEWTEALTILSHDGITNEMFGKMKTMFSDKEITDITFAVMIINAWNRAGLAFRSVPGSADKAYGLERANLS